MANSPAPVRAAAAAGVEQAAVAGPLAAVARGLARREPGRAVLERRQAGHELAVDVQLGLHRVRADPVLLVGLDVAGVRERVGVGALGFHPPVVLELGGELVGARLRRRVVRHVGVVVQAADVVDGVVELLGAHAGPLDVAVALGPAVAVLVELRRARTRARGA